MTLKVVERKTIVHNEGVTIKGLYEKGDVIKFKYTQSANASHRETVSYSKILIVKAQIVKENVDAKDGDATWCTKVFYVTENEKHISEDQVMELIKPMNHIEEDERKAN